MFFYCVFFFHVLITHSSAVDFLFNSFNSATNLTLIGDAYVDAPVIRLTNDSHQSSIGRTVYPTPLTMRNQSANNTNATISSFSTSFIFSILPKIETTIPGFGMAFFLCNTTEPPGAISGQYFGLFTNGAPISGRAPMSGLPLIVVEFDTGINPEFNDPDGNHVGIDLNDIVSVFNETAGYWVSGEFRSINMRSGQNIRAWIEFDGTHFQINVTIAPAGVSKPAIPLISYTNPEIANYVSDQMFVGFSASKATWVERQRILAWSFSDTGRPERELNTTNLPVFPLETSSSSSPSAGLIAGVTMASAVLLGLFLGGLFWIWRKKQGKNQTQDTVEDWELEYWPHRISYEELHTATKGFSQQELLGFGGFGRVYKGVLPNNNSEVAVKCISHDSKQGLREFMAEISSVGRLQHKNLVNLRGWCRKQNELMLVYDYMPNGSLDKWIFEKPNSIQLLGWSGRRRVLCDVGEGLLYLHHGWDQMVLHRDIKSSNILLDGEMRARLGDFGLAKLYQHGQAPSNTRVVGTLGYLAPELANVPAPTASSDVYSFGVVMLEVATGKRRIGACLDDEDDPLLVDWVRELYSEGRVLDAADERIAGEYERQEMERVLKLGLACCHPEPEQRPTMKEVLAVLLGDEPVSPPGSLVVDIAGKRRDGPKGVVGDGTQGE